MLSAVAWLTCLTYRRCAQSGFIARRHGQCEPMTVAWRSFNGVWSSRVRHLRHYIVNVILDCLHAIRAPTPRAPFSALGPNLFACSECSQRNGSVAWGRYWFNRRQWRREPRHLNLSHSSSCMSSQLSSSRQSIRARVNSSIYVRGNMHRSRSWRHHPRTHLRSPS